MGPDQRIRTALVLQAREEALRAEQAQMQRILAANMERDRISESIQSEVTMTLTRRDRPGGRRPAHT